MFVQDKTQTKTSILGKVHPINAKELDTIIGKRKLINVTITSPPYFNLKDYGVKGQIGYGQKYREEYIPDLKTVFDKVYKVTEDNGSLWVIIDAFRKGKEVVPLPFDFAEAIKPIGWTLKEVIIWEKDRTVPWAHHGQMRSLFEYILVFAKSEEFKFRIDRVRSFENLKQWWVKYPERYNPKGKLPGSIWNYDIPTQGSWGNGILRHFCPLPEAMIERILTITTDEKDVVLDPFAGSGTVLLQADAMKRKFMGFELNETYIKMFESIHAATKKEKRKEYEAGSEARNRQKKFERLIYDLRALKYARMIYKEIGKTCSTHPIRVYVNTISRRAKGKDKLMEVEYHLLLPDTLNANDAGNLLNEVSVKAPLSKYGIVPQFRYHRDSAAFAQLLNRRNLYLYTKTNTYNTQGKYDGEFGKQDVIVSPLKVEVDPKKYDAPLG